MTADMLLKARRNAEKGDYQNVEFRLGEIEHLPLADASVDVIISNCVINLSPDKPQVFREAFRVLKPGGRLCISDVVTGAPLSEEVKRDLDLHCGCLAGASVVSELQACSDGSGLLGGEDPTKGRKPRVHQRVGTRPPTGRGRGFRAD